MSPADPVTLEIGRDGGSLRGVAGDRDTTYVAMTVAAKTTVEARRRDGRTAWTVTLDGTGGPLARAGDLVVATLGGTASVGGVVIRGEPGGVVVGLDAAAGAARWTRSIDASEWVVISAIAAAPTNHGDDIVLGGSFSGTLRAGATVVSSAGKSDGFVARLDPRGEVKWLVRVGGVGADAVQGVAATDGRVAIAGSFVAGAELGGQVLAAYDETAMYSDAFVGVLDASGKAAWVTTFGGRSDETIAGVAIDAAGRVGVAASLREVVHVTGTDFVAHGPSDGLVAWWSAEGAAGGALQIGGSEFDGLRGIIAVDARFVVAGFFAGELALGGKTFTAGDGDDAFVALVDPARGQITTAWQVGGDGREEIAALAPVPGGFIAGVAHTAIASFDGVALPAPRDPMAGAAIVVRATR